MPPKSVEVLLKEKKVYQVPKGSLVQASPDISVKKAIETMQTERRGYVALTKGKRVVGIFTETDVARKILGQDVDWSQSVSHFMVKDPISLTPNDSVGKAIHLMGKHRVYHLPIVEKNGDLVEVLSVRALIRFLAEFYPTEIYNLPPNPDQIMESAEGG